MLYMYAISLCTFAFLCYAASLSSPYPGQVRLVGGDSPSSGVVEMFATSWASVCSDGFTHLDALSICHQLGYTAVADHVR